MGIEDKLGRGSKALLLLAATVVVMIGLHLATSIVVPLLVAAFVAAATVPISRWLTGKGLPNGISVFLVIIGVLGLLGALGFVITAALVDFNDSLPKYMDEVSAAKRDVAVWAAEHGMGRAAQTLHAFDVGDWLADLLAKGLLSGAPNFLSAFVIIFLVVAFILLEAATFQGKLAWAHRVGGAKLAHLSSTVNEIQKYLGVKTGISAATGVLTGAWAAVLGVEHALLWGLLGFTLNFVPNVGSILAAVPPVLVALAQEGPGTALAVAVGFVVINMTLGNVLEPKLMGRALGLSPLVVVLSMIVWGFVLGPIGAVLSAPLTMILKIVLANTEDLRWVAVLLAPPRSEDWHERHSLPPITDPMPTHPGLHGNEAE